jgi:hypothetical protein
LRILFSLLERGGRKEQSFRKNSSPPGDFALSVSFPFWSVLLIIVVCLFYIENGYYDLIPFFFTFLLFTQKLKTRVVRKSINPEWNDELTLSIEDPAVLVKLVCLCKK